jgi:transcriptional regulator with XRE-family HTH domain
MAAMSIMKRKRVEAGLTQAQVASAVKVSQAQYYRWESQSAAVPDDKIKKLAKVLKTSEEALRGAPAPISMPWDANDESGSRDPYFGDVAFHFVIGSALCAPISVNEMAELRAALDGDDPFILLSTLDNRAIIICRAAIADVVISAEDSDTHGPEETNYEDNLECRDDEDFWRIVEQLGFGEMPAGISRQRVAEVLQQLGLPPADDPSHQERILEQLQAEAGPDSGDGAIPLRAYFDRATRMEWQLVSGRKRSIKAPSGAAMFELAMDLEEATDGDDTMCQFDLPEDGQSIYIALEKITYLWFPRHRLTEADLEQRAAILDRAENVVH